MKKLYCQSNLTYLGCTMTALLLSSAVSFNLTAKAAGEEKLFASTPLSSHKLAQATPAKQEKPRIAVWDFDFSSVSTPYISLVEGSRGVSDMLVNKLVQSGKFRVIERSKLEAVIKEQNLGASGRVDAATAARIGKILGVESIIIGTITQLDVEEKRDGFSIFGIGSDARDVTAYVKLNVRVVNTTTSEIEMVAEGNGTSNQASDSVSVGVFSGNRSTSNQGKLITQATEQAIQQVSEQLTSKY